MNEKKRASLTILLKEQTAKQKKKDSLENVKVTETKNEQTRDV